MDNKLSVKAILAPGVWVDMNDELHVSVSDLLDEFGLEHTEENKAKCEREIQAAVRKSYPDIKFVAVGACPNCGIVDGEKHRPDCELA